MKRLWFFSELLTFRIGSTKSVQSSRCGRSSASPVSEFLTVGHSDLEWLDGLDSSIPFTISSHIACYMLNKESGKAQNKSHGQQTLL